MHDLHEYHPRPKKPGVFQSWGEALTALFFLTTGVLVSVAVVGLIVVAMVRWCR